MSKKKYFTEEERKAAHRAESAKYRQANREEVLAKKKEYYRANKEVIAAKKKEYRQTNKEVIAAKKIEYRQTLTGMCVQKTGRYRWFDRKYFGTDEGSVTTEQMQEMIETHPKCFYCGCEDISQLGLDRIDNSKPHTVDNCVVACWNCNNERRRMPFEEYLDKVHTRTK